MGMGLLAELNNEAAGQRKGNRGGDIKIDGWLQLYLLLPLSASDCKRTFLHVYKCACRLKAVLPRDEGGTLLGNGNLPSNQPLWWGQGSLHRITYSALI